MARPKTQRGQPREVQGVRCLTMVLDVVFDCGTMSMRCITADVEGGCTCL